MDLGLCLAMREFRRARRRAQVLRGWDRPEAGEGLALVSQASEGNCLQKLCFPVQIGDLFVVTT